MDYQPSAVRDYLAGAHLRQRAKDAEADATALRESLKVAEQRLAVLESAIRRAWGPTVLSALQSTHPALWPDEVQTMNDLSA